MECKVCGRDNLPEARFCANCGAALVTAVEPPSSAAAAVEYMGFWIRLGAAIIDVIIIWFISSVLSYSLLSSIVGYRISFLFSPFWFPAYWLYYWLFTGLKGQTPGKMVVGIKVVNAQGDRVGLGVAALREFVRFISAYVLCLGFLWIIWDKQKQGWHDKIASTYVVKVVKA